MTKYINKQSLQWIAVFIFLVFSRIPFYYTQHVQEDAYIHFRCAKLLAETGVYGFNLGEQVSASTSHAYVLIVAAMIYLFGDLFVLPVLILNTIAIILGLYLFTSVIFFEFRYRMLLWIFVSLTPIALMISYSGMETSFLLLNISIAYYGFFRSRTKLYSYIALALMPWFRPDAVVYGFLLILALFFAGRKKLFLLAGVSLSIGVLSVLLFNGSLGFGGVGDR